MAVPAVVLKSGITLDDALLMIWAALERRYRYLPEFAAAAATNVRVKVPDALISNAASVAPWDPLVPESVVGLLEAKLPADVILLAPGSVVPVPMEIPPL